MAVDLGLAALEYLERGWPVFPVDARTKRPLVAWKVYQTTLPTEEEVEKWWEQWPEAGIGMATGGLARVVVVDIDLHKIPAGEREQTIAWVNQTFGQSGHAVRTQSGGGHRYYLHPGGDVVVPNAARVGGRAVDVRGDGGYVLLPPTPGYEWLRTCEPEEWPVWPADQLPEINLATGHTDTKFSLTEPVSEGARNDTLARVAGARLARGERVEEVLIYCLGLNGTFDPPLDEEEVRTTVASIAARDAREHPSGHGRTEEADFEDARSDLTPRELLVNRLSYQLSNGACSAGRFLNAPPPPQDWIFSGIIPRGTVGMIVASGGTGKGFFSLYLAVCAALGEPFCEHGCDRPLDVLIVTLEDTEDILHRRLVATFENAVPFATDEQRALLADHLRVVPLIGTAHDLSTLAETLCAVVKGGRTFDLIIIDPLGKALPGGQGGMGRDGINSAEGASLVHRYLWQIVAASGGRSTVVACHHVPKHVQAGGGELGQVAASGHHFLIDFARFSIHLRKIPREEVHKRGLERGVYIEALTPKQNNAPELTEALIFRREKEGALYPVKAKSQAEIDGARVLEAIQENAPCSERALRNVFGPEEEGGKRQLSVNRVRDSVQFLVENGYAEHDGNHRLVFLKAMVEPSFSGPTGEVVKTVGSGRKIEPTTYDPFDASDLL